MSGSLRAGVTFPSSSPLEGNPSTHWAFRPVCVHPKRESSETQHTDRTRAGHHRRAFPVLRKWSPASTRCERTAAREDRSSDSKVDRSRRQEKHHRGMRPRVVISSGGAARPNRTRVKNGCRARNERPLQGSRASRAKVSSAEETRAFHEAWCASRSWSVATKALETARGPLEADDRRQRRYVTRAVGNKTPGSAPLTDRPKHARRRESPSDLVRTPQGDQLQEPHDT